MPTYDVIKNRLTNGEPFAVDTAIQRIDYLANNLLITSDEAEELTALAHQHGEIAASNTESRLTALENDMAEVKGKVLGVDEALDIVEGE